MNILRKGNMSSVKCRVQESVRGSRDKRRMLSRQIVGNITQGVLIHERVEGGRGAVAMGGALRCPILHRLSVRRASTVYTNEQTELTESGEVGYSLQFSSSELSPQSFWLSHLQWSGMQLLFSQWNSWGPQVFSSFSSGANKHEDENCFKEHEY